MTIALLAPPAYVLALAYLAGLLTSALKPGIESIVGPQNRWHDLLFTLLPLGLSLGFTVGYAVAYRGDIFLAVVWATLASAGATGAYLVHTRTRGAPQAASATQMAPAATPGAGPSVSEPPSEIT